jgi:hypothetical protein
VTIGIQPESLEKKRNSGTGPSGRPVGRERVQAVRVYWGISPVLLSEVQVATYVHDPDRRDH